ncbi:hypothetical protein M3Y97_00266600 [Aphelenchoides bicaudatus]|nr:hypothetical protein M3Y97_00266600 [Aphelenchoides bicaudatus]
MLTMFSQQLATDVSVKCESETFLAHKSILSAHSIVFRTMFEHTLTKESQTSEVLIEEFDPIAVLIMLQWFYSAEVCLPYEEVRGRYLTDERCSCSENEQGTSNSTPSCSCHTLTDELLLQITELSHKYALEEMQFQCEEKWAQRLSPENIYDCLYYAELFQLYSLKLSCTEMIRQIPELMAGERWTRLVEWQPEIEQRICVALEIEPSTSKKSE